MMALELPLVSAVVNRLPEPRVHLAAYGGIVLPLALIIESPIIMLLATSTALSRDWSSYLKLRGFMHRAGAALTAIHALVAFTPLYDLLTVGVIHAPREIIEPARLGAMIMTPWTWSIAYRRFHQGVLIRFGHPRAVGIGTVLRLSANALVLTTGYLLGRLPGIVVAVSAVTSGVVCEAIYAGWCVRPVLRSELRPSPVVEPPLSTRDFLSFYVPLALTSLLYLLVEPIGAAAMSRMPRPLASLAVWPVMYGLVFIIEALGIAYQEVVVALLPRPGASRPLARFAALLATANALLLLLVAATPLSRLWFESAMALAPDLVLLARRAIWLAVPVPALAVLQSWLQGTLVHRERTRGIIEAVAIFLLAISAVYVFAVRWGKLTGIYVSLFALVIGIALQVAWLRHRSGSLRSGQAS